MRSRLIGRRGGAVGRARSSSRTSRSRISNAGILRHDPALLRTSGRSTGGEARCLGDTRARTARSWSRRASPHGSRACSLSRSRSRSGRGGAHHLRLRGGGRRARRDDYRARVGAGRARGERCAGSCRRVHLGRSRLRPRPLASEQEVDLLLVDAPDALLSAGVPSGDLAHVWREAPCDVAVFVAGHASSLGDGPVLVPFGGGEHDWAAVEIGAWLAAAHGVPLQLLGSAAEPVSEVSGMPAGRLPSSRSSSSVPPESPPGPLLVAPGEELLQGGQGRRPAPPWPLRALVGGGSRGRPARACTGRGRSNATGAKRSSARRPHSSGADYPLHVELRPRQRRFL